MRITKTVIMKTMSQIKNMHKRKRNLSIVKFSKMTHPSLMKKKNTKLTSKKKIRINMKTTIIRNKMKMMRMLMKTR